LDEVLSVKIYVVTKHFHKALDLMMKAVEMEYNIWHMECMEPVKARVTYGNFPEHHTKILLS